jgi:hypothetical protein
MMQRAAISCYPRGLAILAGPAAPFDGRRAVAPKPSVAKQETCYQSRGGEMLREHATGGTRDDARADRNQS